MYSMPPPLLADFHSLSRLSWYPSPLAPPHLSPNLLNCSAYSLSHLVPFILMAIMISISSGSPTPPQLFSIFPLSPSSLLPSAFHYHYIPDSKWTSNILAWPSIMSRFFGLVEWSMGIIILWLITTYKWTHTMYVLLGLCYIDDILNIHLST